MIDYVRAVLNVSIVLNEAVFEEIREAGNMKEAVERLFKKEMEEQRQEGFLEALAGLVKKGLLSLTDAAEEAGLSPAEFQVKDSRDEINSNSTWRQYLPFSWIEKTTRNMEEDRENAQGLRFREWTVLRFWERDIMKQRMYGRKRSTMSERMMQNMNVNLLSDKDLSIIKIKLGKSK